MSALSKRGGRRLVLSYNKSSQIFANSTRRSCDMRWYGRLLVWWMVDGGNGLLEPVMGHGQVDFLIVSRMGEMSCGKCSNGFESSKQASTPQI